MTGYEKSPDYGGPKPTWYGSFLWILLLVLAISAYIYFTRFAEAAEQVSGHAIVVDADTIDINDVRIRIFGIDAPEVGQDCKTGRGGTWACGKKALERLNDLTAIEAVTCSGSQVDDYGRLIAHCSLSDGRDIAQLLVREGMAWAFIKYAKDYVSDEAIARKQKVGIWQGEAQPAWDFRAARWNVAQHDSPEGCPIKGNISRKGERIYHAPWSPWYTKTRVNLKAGERWFCSEAEAIKAGWRAPIWGRR